MNRKPSPCIHNRLSSVMSTSKNPTRTIPCTNAVISKTRAGPIATFWSQENLGGEVDPAWKHKDSGAKPSREGKIFHGYTVPMYRIKTYTDTRGADVISFKAPGCKLTFVILQGSLKVNRRGQSYVVNESWEGVFEALYVYGKTGDMSAFDGMRMKGR